MSACSLLIDGESRSHVEVAMTRLERRRGLLGRKDLDGALLLAPCRSVHTISMRFDLNVAYLRRTDVPKVYEVIRVGRMRRNRIGLPVLRAHAVLEASAGSFARWKLDRFSLVEIR